MNRGQSLGVAIAVACLLGCAKKPAPANGSKSDPASATVASADAVVEAQAELIRTQQEMIDESQRTLELEAQRSAELKKELAEVRLRLAAEQKELDKARETETLRVVPEDASTQSADEAEAVQPANPITCIVAEVELDVGLVLLTAGADDGMKKGYRFTILRGEEQVGKVEVLKVWPDKSSARILKDMTVGEIRKGDHAATHVF